MTDLRRFLRLAKGGRKVALADFESVPELAGNPFIMRIFQLFDADQDGCLNFEEFIRAVESFGRLYTSQDKCMCKCHSHFCCSMRPDTSLHATLPEVTCM